MAPETLVLDASVGVKWFSGIGEDNVPQARAILAEVNNRSLVIVVPELFFHEIANALVHKVSLPSDTIFEMITELFSLNITVVHLDATQLKLAAKLARQNGITEYDACYVALAIIQNCTLVTDNSKHQGKIKDCRVLPISEWASRQ